MIAPGLEGRLLVQERICRGIAKAGLGKAMSSRDQAKNLGEATHLYSIHRSHHLRPAWWCIKYWPDTNRAPHLRTTQRRVGFNVAYFKNLNFEKSYATNTAPNCLILGSDCS